MNKIRPHQSALPLWTGLAILIAALVTGLLISVLTGDVSWPYGMCLVVSAIVVAAFVEPRGIFLTVATIPLWFAIVTPLAGWLMTLRTGSEATRPFSKTTLITSAFPAAELFPWLLTAFVAALLIGGVRLWWLNKRSEVSRRRERYARRVTAEADRRNRKARLSVAELVARNEAEDAIYRGTATRGTASRSGASHVARPYRPDPDARAGQPRR